MIAGIGNWLLKAAALGASTVLSLVMASTAVSAATLTVETAEDLIADNGECSLREAIINANNGDQSGSSDCPSGTGPAVGKSDTIDFSPALDGTPIVLSLTGTGENDSFTGDLDLSDWVAIVGNGPDQTIIDASGIDRVIEVRDDEAALTTMSASLIGLTVRNGSVPGAGGGVLSLGASTTLVVENCVIDNNTSLGATTSALGGGIASEGPAAVTDTVLANNLASASGGMLAAGGGLLADDTLLVRQAEFTNNRADSETGAARGGGLFSTPGDNAMVVEDSIIRGNSAEGGEALGGGVYSQDLPSSGFVQAGIQRTEISANTAIAPGGISAGGGVYAGAPGSLALFNVTVSGNSAGDGVSASAIGGGIAVNDAGFWMGNTTVAENSVNAGPDAQGGGLYVETSGAAALVINSIIATNTASENGAPDCSGPIESNGYNLLGSNAGCPDYTPGTNDIIGDVASGGAPVDPLMGPLQDNGGRSRTMALQADSSAIDAGNPGSSVATERCRDKDQRNIARPLDGDDDAIAICDMGAFELADDLLFRDRFEAD